MKKENEGNELKKDILDELKLEERRDRREQKNESATSFEERRSGSDRRNNNLIGGRRKTDLTEEDAKEFEKIISGGDAKKALDRLEEKNYRSLNDEAKKIEIKKTIGIHRLNSQRLSTLVFLVVLTACMISIMYYFVDKNIRIRRENEKQVNQITQTLSREKRLEVDKATLENMKKITEKR